MFWFYMTHWPSKSPLFIRPCADIPRPKQSCSSTMTLMFSFVTWYFTFLNLFSFIVLNYLISFALSLMYVFLLYYSYLMKKIESPLSTFLP